MSISDTTIVVCTYNRAGMLRDALESLVHQETAEGFQFEILVVDNGSTDNTQEVIAQFAADSPVPIRGVIETKSGVACARNRGIKEARGAWIAFCDDDQTADPTWLSQLILMAAETGSPYVGGAIRLKLPVPEQEVPIVVRKTMSESFGRDTKQRFSRIFTPGTGSLLVHKSVFERVGLFDESLEEAGEDTDLFRRIRTAGIVAWYTPHAVVRHVIPEYRLQENYLRWTTRRAGWCFAQRDRKEWGLGILVLLMIARVIKSLLIRFPKQVLAFLRGDRNTLVGLRCSRWRNEAYVRGVLWQLAPRLCAQRRFYSQLEFREERRQFDDPTEATPKSTEATEHLELTSH
jgi:glycosyltransferase involved in cell wall biosynthesis